MNWQWEERGGWWMWYRFPAFRPRATVRGAFEDPKVRIVRLERRGKTLCAEPAVQLQPNVLRQNLIRSTSSTEI